MVGSTGERVLRATLPYVDAWNTWFEQYGNAPERFEHSNREVSRIADEVGRDPGTVRRSACVLVSLDRATPERPIDEVAPVEGTSERIADAIRAIGEAGADEVIAVLSPITERSIREFGEVLAALQA